MSRLQGLLFALATVVLVVVSTYYFMRPWLPALKSDRAAIDHSIWWSLLVTGLVFIATNLVLAWLTCVPSSSPNVLTRMTSSHFAKITCPASIG